MEEIKTHKCRGCNKEFPSTEEFFYKAVSKLGFQTRCKDCVKNKKGIRLKYVKPDTKICYSCKIEKPFDKEHFVSNSFEKVGLGCICIDCQRKKNGYKGNRQVFVSDNVRKLSNYYRVQLNRYLETKGRTTMEILGCSFEELEKHIEDQFVDGMSWENWGKINKEKQTWNIDHYYPLAKAQTEKEVMILNHYSNLQPLWAVDNIKKSSNCPRGYYEWIEMMKEKFYGDTDD